MKKKDINMKVEIHMISNYKALILTRVSLSCFLIVSTIYVGILNYPPSSFYIFLTLNILPSIFIYTFKDYAIKYPNKLIKLLTEEPLFRLKILKRKYHFTQIKYSSNLLSLFLANILLLFWQYYCNQLQSVNYILLYQPILLIGFHAIFYVVCATFYKLKITYDLNHNRV